MKRHIQYSLMLYLLFTMSILTACEPQNAPPRTAQSMMAGHQSLGDQSTAGQIINVAGQDSMTGGMVNIEGGSMTAGAQGGEEIPSNQDLFIPAPAKLARLTRDELSNTLISIFGQGPSADRFEVDSALHGFVRVASTEITVSPLLAEQLEEISWELATAVTERAQQRIGLLGCDPIQEATLNQETEMSCVKNAIFTVGQRLWRRPLEPIELEELLSLYTQVKSQTRSSEVGLRASLSALIQSPHTLFRVELGEAHPNPPNHDPDRLRYTSLEMASRLSYLLWGGPPDEELMAVAGEGLLLQDQALRAQIERLLSTERAQKQLAIFFDEMLGLNRLPFVSKDPTLFPSLNAELIHDMRQEFKLLFERIALAEGRRFDELFTTNLTFVTAPLASLYGLTLPPNADPRAMTELQLDPSQERGGLLGRAGLLTLLSHPAQTSPTLRGRFIRSGLLCQDVPPPPEGVVTELPNPSDGMPQTLRMRLSAHVSDPVCAGCHTLMDPLGFPLEAFDPIGQVRYEDQGLPLDLSGTLDGQSFNGAQELGTILAQSSLLGKCITTRLYRYATAHLEEVKERPLLSALSDRFNEDLNRQFTSLIIEMLMSKGFREARPDEGAPLYPRVGCETERCDGIDNDCDGQTDETLTQSCDAGCQLTGIKQCLHGQWSVCEAPQVPLEVCDGLDNDCDGETDEDLNIQESCNQSDDDCDGEIDEDSTLRPHPTNYEILSTYHEGCSLTGLRYGNACHAAINRLCQAEGCGGTGFGPAENSSGTLFAICVPENLLNRRMVSYATLSSHHQQCNGNFETAGPNCNAAIHRLCASEGLTTGFGPLEHSATEAAITCVPSAQVIVTSYSELQPYQSACSASAERIGPACQEAIHAHCADHGFRTGWGPLENNGDIAVIACLPN